MTSYREFQARLKLVGNQYKQDIKGITDFTNFTQWEIQAKQIWVKLAKEYELHE